VFQHACADEHAQPREATDEGRRNGAARNADAATTDATTALAKSPGMYTAIARMSVSTSNPARAAPIGTATAYKTAMPPMMHAPTLAAI
jgi:hypothetical protein